MHQPATTEQKELWQRRYEQLRQQASGDGEGLTLDTWGLSLLQRQGVLGWMRAWRDPVACTQQVSGPADPLRMDQIGPYRHEMTLLLANMALTHAKQPAVHKAYDKPRVQGYERAPKKDGLSLHSPVNPSASA